MEGKPGVGIWAPRVKVTHVESEDESRESQGDSGMSEDEENGQEEEEEEEEEEGDMMSQELEGVDVRARVERFNALVIEDFDDTKDL
jgi:hypothetical protein